MITKQATGIKVQEELKKRQAENKKKQTMHEKYRHNRIREQL